MSTTTDLDKYIKLSFHSYEWGEMTLLEQSVMRELALHELAKLRKALDDAIDFAEEGWSYADKYFKDKWGFEEGLAELKKVQEEYKK